MNLRIIENNLKLFLICFIISILIILFFVNCKNANNSMNLSSPESSFQSFISALKSGNSENVRKVTTENGFNSLIIYISPYSAEDPCGHTFKTWGESWSEWEIRWKIKNKQEALALMGPEIKEHTLKFINMNGEWKLDQWIPGD